MTKTQLREMLPKVGDVRTERMTLSDRTDLNPPEECVVVEVRPDRLWYRVRSREPVLVSATSCREANTRRCSMQHPEITWIEHTGYPSWMQGREEPEFDEDAAYEERREKEMFGDD